MSETAVPAWAKEYVAAWRDRLLLASWQIRVGTSDAPGGDTNVLGHVELYPEILTAHITFRGDIAAEPDDEWQRTIIHELVHVRLAEATELVRDDILPELGAAAERIAFAAFRRAVEPAVESLAHVLWRLENNDSSDTNENA